MSIAKKMKKLADEANTESFDVTWNMVLNKIEEAAKRGDYTATWFAEVKQRHNEAAIIKGLKTQGFFVASQGPSFYKIYWS